MEVAHSMQHSGGVMVSGSSGTLANAQPRTYGIRAEVRF